MSEPVEDTDRRKNGHLLKWNGQINIPTVIGVILFLGGAWKWTSDMNRNATDAVAEVVKINAKMDQQGDAINSRMDKFQESMTAIQLTLAKQDGLATAVADHEARIRLLEGKR